MNKVRFASHYGFGDGLLHLDLIRMFLERCPRDEIIFYGKHPFLREAARSCSFITHVLDEPWYPYPCESYDFSIDQSMMWQGYTLGQAFAKGTFGWENCFPRPYVEYEYGGRDNNLVSLQHALLEDLSKGYVVLNPFTGTNRHVKQWRQDRWYELACAVNEEFGMSCIMLGGTEDGPPGGSGSPAPSCARLFGASLELIGGLLFCAHFYIGLASGLTYLALALGGPARLIQLFSTKSEPASWSSLLPYGEEGVIVAEDISLITVSQVMDVMRRNMPWT